MNTDYTDTNADHDMSSDRVIHLSSFAAPSQAKPSDSRRFLFLQGPHGPFFATLARRLTKEGHSVQRIHFNGGDKGDWMPGQGISYTGNAAEWTEYLTDYLFRHEITDIAFYGYWRPLHQTAITLAKKLNIKLHGFEEGLLRPHWITLDPRLPCEQTHDLKTAVTGEKPMVTPYTVQPTGKSPVPHNPTAWMITHCIRYYMNYFKHRKIFTSYRTHRLMLPGEEARAWVYQTAFYPWRKLVSTLRLQNALRHKTPMFLFCLQLDTDSQIRKYSTFSGMEEVMTKVLTSFAANAAAGTRLVIKNHPLDNGTGHLENACWKIARKLGIANRITFLNFGKLAGLLKNASGMIAVNSTAGLQALYHKCPVKTLGLSIYNIPGLADDQPLDTFWTDAKVPDTTVYDKLHDTLVQTSQHAGNFYDANCYADIINSVMPAMTEEEEAEVISFADKVAAKG